MMNAKTKLLGAAALSLMVAACGTDPRERTTGGAAAGAATGAAVGALGGPPGVLAGAAIGGGVGAVTGATTSPSDVDLGRPVWSDRNTRMSGTRGGAGTTSQAQAALNSRGYNVGSVDGRMGPQTSRAVMDFQRANNMSATGRLDGATLAALNVGAEGAASTRGTSSSRAPMRGGMQTSQRGTSPDRSGTATDADPGTGGTGGSGGSVAPRPTTNFGGTTSSPTQERSGTATGADPGTGGTGGSGGGVSPLRGSGVPASPSTAGGSMERSGTATGADPGTGGTGGSGGGATGAPRR